MLSVFKCQYLQKESERETGRGERERDGRERERETGGERERNSDLGVVHHRRKTKGVREDTYNVHLTSLGVGSWGERCGSAILPIFL